MFFPNSSRIWGQRKCIRCYLFLVMLVLTAGFVSSLKEVNIVAHSNTPGSRDQTTAFSTLNSLIYGPGLEPHLIVLPARYFYIQLISHDGSEFQPTSDTDDLVKVRIDCNGERQIWTQVLNRRNGSYIVRYKMFQSCLSGLRIIVTHKNQHLAKSPYIIKVPVHPDICDCPKLESADWFSKVNCMNGHKQVDDDLAPFKSVDFSNVISQAIERFYQPGSHSFCHYTLKENKIYRKCYGQHVGFHIFPDAILLSLTRKMFLPNMNFIINLGDWPLVDLSGTKPIMPIFSWCKSNTTADILLPTYELVEASLEGMGRVSLDMMTVQSNSEITWEDKIPKVFWRGRDSRQERLDLIAIAKRNPDIINASLTNFFFFRDQIDVYGPKAQHISFFKFFDYKYQLNIDGTVAAYRFPFLLGGDSVVLKTDSPYLEHFYRDLVPWTHYVPVKADLSNLIETIQWLKDHDDEAKKISQNGRKYAQENLMPLNVVCYYVEVFEKWAAKLKDSVTVLTDMEEVPQPDLPKATKCDCKPKIRERDQNPDEKNEL